MLTPCLSTSIPRPPAAWGEATLLTARVRGALGVLALAALAAASGSAAAQAVAAAAPVAPRPVPAGAQPDPLDPQVPVPLTVYRSALQTYRGGDAPALQPWREANEAVSRIGGWRVYLRDGQATPPPAEPRR